MNGDVVEQRPMNRQQLRAIVYRIAVTYMEVERGLRAPDQLAAFLTSAEYERHRSARGIRAAARPVRPPDIGRVRIDAATPDRINASVMLRRDDGGWSTLLVDLRQTGRRWQVESLDRLERLVPREPRQIDIDDGEVASRLRAVEEERRLVAAALDAVSERMSGVRDGRTKAARALRAEVGRLTHQIEQLDTELATLAGRGRQRDLDSSLGSGSEDPTRWMGDGEDISSILGDRPEDPGLRQVWDDASGALRAYRDEWALRPDEPVLRQANSSEQAADRQDVIRLLRNAAKALGSRDAEVDEPAVDTAWSAAMEL